MSNELKKLEKKNKELESENKSLKESVAKLEESLATAKADSVSPEQHKEIVDGLNQRILDLEASQSKYADDSNQKLVIAEQTIEELKTQLEHASSDGGISKEEAEKLQEKIESLKEQVKQKTVYTQLKVITNIKDLDKNKKYVTAPSGRGWVEK